MLEMEISVTKQKGMNQKSIVTCVESLWCFLRRITHSVSNTPKTKTLIKTNPLINFPLSLNPHNQSSSSDLYKLNRWQRRTEF